MKKLFLIIVVLTATSQIGNYCYSKVVGNIPDIIWYKEWGTMFTTFDFSPKENYVACGERDYPNGVVKFDILTGDSIGSFQEINNEGVVSICFNPDGTLLAGCSRTGRVFVWNTITGEERVIDDTGRAGKMVFSPDGSMLAMAAQASGVLVYETVNWKRILTWTETWQHPKYGTMPTMFNDVSFRYDNKVLAMSTNQLNFVKLYYIETKQVIKIISQVQDGEYSPVRNELLSKKVKNIDSRSYMDSLVLFKLDTISQPICVVNYPEPYLIQPQFVNFNYSHDGIFISLVSAGVTNIININSLQNILSFVKNDGVSILNNTNKYLFSGAGGLLVMFDVSKYTNIQEPEHISELKLYPNPTKENILIEYSIAEFSDIQLFITDLTGNYKVVILSEFKPTGNYRLEYKTNHLASGTYFITMKHNGKTLTQQFKIIR